jgi:hypothetical protein
MGGREKEGPKLWEDWQAVSQEIEPWYPLGLNFFFFSFFQPTVTIDSPQDQGDKDHPTSNATRKVQCQPTLDRDSQNDVKSSTPRSSHFRVIQHTATEDSQDEVESPMMTNPGLHRNAIIPKSQHQPGTPARPEWIRPRQHKEINTGVRRTQKDAGPTLVLGNRTTTMANST